MFYAGQISTRIGWIRTVPLLLIYLLLFVIAFFVSIIGAAKEKDWGAIFFLPGLAAVFFLVALRYKFVQHFSIDEGGLMTCCAGFWCVPCSLCQMGRHLHGYTKLFDGDGDIDGNVVYGNTAAMAV